MANSGKPDTEKHHILDLENQIHSHRWEVKEMYGKQGFINSVEFKMNTADLLHRKISVSSHVSDIL